jgi:biopolymer transport protein ExbB
MTDANATTAQALLAPADAAQPLPVQPTADASLAFNDRVAALWSPANAWPGADLLSTVQGRLQDLLAAGGPVVVVLGLLSVVALAMVLLKLWQFHRLQLDRLGPVQTALKYWRAGADRAAADAVADSGQPVAHLVAIAMSGLQRPGVAPPLLREELSRVASVQLERLRSHLRALEIIGTLSPLLGLLGTVLGMIDAFQQLQAAGSQVDPAILSGGIWQALLTTAVGLTVAIPVVLAHAWLERRVERCGHQMEDAVTQVFTRGLEAAEIPEPAAHASVAQPVPGLPEAGYAT